MGEPRGNLQKIEGESLGFQNLAKPAQGVDLDLPHPLAGDADLIADLFQGRLFQTPQPEPPFHHNPLLVVELIEPLIQLLVEVGILQ